MADWEARWANENTPWALNVAHPTLEVEQATWPKGTCLVTGAGLSHDAIALAAADRLVTAVDLAPSAKTAFDQTYSAHANHAFVEYVVEDYFSDQTSLKTYDLIWDYTFFCAIAPAMRSDWARVTAKRLAPNGILCMLLFPVDADRDPKEGPPFAIDIDEVTSTLSDAGLHQLSCTPASKSPRPRKGREWLAKFKHAEK